MRTKSQGFKFRDVPNHFLRDGNRGRYIVDLTIAARKGQPETATSCMSADRPHPPERSRLSRLHTNFQSELNSGSERQGHLESKQVL